MQTNPTTVSKITTSLDHENIIVDTEFNGKRVSDCEVTHVNTRTDEVLTMTSRLGSLSLYVTSALPSNTSFGQHYHSSFCCKDYLAHANFVGIQVQVVTQS